MIALLRSLRSHLRPSPAEVARDEELLAALNDSAADDPDGYERVWFLMAVEAGA